MDVEQTKSNIPEEDVYQEERHKKILELLQENARMESTKISSLVNITAEAVSYRIKNLVKKKNHLGRFLARGGHEHFTETH